MSDCITALIAALVITSLLGDRNSCGSSHRRHNRGNDHSCGCDGN